MQAKHEQSKCKDSCNFVSSVGETPPYHLMSRFTTAAIIFARKYSVLSIQLFRPLCSSSYEQGMGERIVLPSASRDVPKQNLILPNQCHENATVVFVNRSTLIVPRSPPSPSSPRVGQGGAINLRSVGRDR